MIKRTWDYISCVLFSAIIGVTVNYLIYIFQVPLIYSVLPLLPSILLTELKIKKKRRTVKYICLLSQVIISFCFFSFMYYEPKSLLLTSIPLSLVLLFWCVLCIEQKIKLDKKNFNLYNCFHSCFDNLLCVYLGLLHSKSCRGHKVYY